MIITTNFVFFGAKMTNKPKACDARNQQNMTYLRTLKKTDKQGRSRIFINISVTIRISISVSGVRINIGFPVWRRLGQQNAPSI